MSDLLLLLGFFIALATGVLTPIFILVKAIETYRLMNRDRDVYVVKSIIALGAWLAVTLVMLYLLFANVFASAHRDRNTPPNWTGLVVFISLILAYGLIGLGLVRWMMRRE